MENKVFFSKIIDPKTCSPLEEMSAKDVADMINKLQKENENLKKIIAKELSENDELGCEFVYVAILKDEIKSLKEQVFILNEKVRILDENACLDFELMELQKRKLDVAKQNLRDNMAPHMYKSVLKDIEALNQFFDEIKELK